MPDYLVRAVSAIRQGGVASNGALIKPGWAMGEFYATDELAFSGDFEVKEWDSTLVRKEWADHATNGPEYISVTCGTLTVVGGERRGDGLVGELDRVAVGPGFSVVLRPGFLRRFECTSDAAGVSVRRPTNVTRGVNMDERRTQDLDEQYRALTEHWKHTDQIRQLLLYNFLMASTILAAAWGLLYTASSKPGILLKALSALGVILSLLWFCVAIRATGYYDMYEAEARRVEDRLPEPDAWPFHARASYRDNFPRVFGQRIRAATITSGVPILFLVFFALTAAF